MFTGIVEEVGTLAERTDAPPGAQLTIGCSDQLREDLGIGHSVAVDGVCLTVTRLTPQAFTAAAMGETLDRTTIGAKQPGEPVNLERALLAGARLGGHLVQGHVDAVGTVTSATDHGAWTTVAIAAPQELHRYLAGEGLRHRRRRRAHDHRGHRRRLRGRPDPAHAAGHDPRRARPRAPGQPRGRRHRQVRRAAPGRRRAQPVRKQRGAPLMAFATIPEAVEAIARGEPIVVVDDPDRENEGDLIMAAELVTPEAMGFFVRHTSGVICAPITAERARALHLPPMVTSCCRGHRRRSARRAIRLSTCGSATPLPSIWVGTIARLPPSSRHSPRSTRSMVATRRRVWNTATRRSPAV